MSSSTLFPFSTVPAGEYGSHGTMVDRAQEQRTDYPCLYRVGTCVSSLRSGVAVVRTPLCATERVETGLGSTSGELFGDWGIPTLGCTENESVRLPTRRWMWTRGTRTQRSAGTLGRGRREIERVIRCVNGREARSS